MKLYEIKDTPLPKELENTLARMITTSEKKMPYRKIDKGQYEIYCPYCQNYKKVSYSELKQIRQKKGDDYYKHMSCPICDNNFTSTTLMTHKRYDDYVSLEIDGKNVGYHVICEWNFGKPIELISISQYALFEKDETYIKCGYALAYFGSKVVFNDDFYNGRYRKATSERYHWNSFDYYNRWLWQYGSRYDKRKFIQDIFKITKSNQIKLLSACRSDNTIDYGYAVKLFEINSQESLEKYVDYINENRGHLRDFRDTKLNEHYLDYLNRNNISLGDYFEYSENLKKLGFKLDKPTDFEHRAKVIDDMVMAEKDKELNNKIESRYNELPKYEKDDITISPFKYAQEVRRCGKALHNCIGGYVERYANEQTDIYHLDVNKKLTIAIEICRKELYQAYADKNSKCPTDLMKHIKSFCKTNGFSLGKYA